jgi:hypothetical protein
MKRYVALSILLALAGACTLILDTSKVIQPCTSGADCKKGFECVDNACLPEDEGGAGEGEGE